MNERVAVVTGAAGALGSAAARRLAADGYRVGLLDLAESSEALRTLRADLGKDARAFPGSLGDAGVWSAALRELGPPTHAVLAAGGWRGGTPLHAEQDDATWQAMMEMNLTSARASLRALLPGMVARKRGSIVVVGSRAAARPWTSAGAAAYAASKAAVVSLAEAVAAEVLEHGVRVNTVLPSTLDTPANRRAMPRADPSNWVSLESAAGVIAFLLSDAARDVSGASVPVYGKS